MSKVKLKLGSVLLLILFVMPVVSLFILCALFLEPMIDKVQVGKLEKKPQHSLCLGWQAAITVFSPG